MTLLPVLLVGLLATAQAETFQTVDTPSGQVRGVIVTRNFGKVAQFRDIPYAEPPVGELRFQKTVPVKPWQGTYDATEFGPSCYQNLDFLPAFKAMVENEELSEDCLKLNIYVPNVVKTNEKKAVMIWIHGGGFSFGQGHAYNSSLLSVIGDVIVVTINYRLGVLGFLSTGDSASPGNYGLWDQIMAFKWVKNNIAAFGGDPESVTIFGESAGSFSVVYQMMIPENKGLFKRAIAESGAGVPPFPFSPTPLKYAQKLGRRLNCTDSEDTEDTVQLMDCIKKFDANVLQDAQNHLQTMSLDPNNVNVVQVLWPSVDGELFIENAGDRLYEDTDMRSFYRSVDLMAGTTNAEGMIMILYAYILQEKYEFNVTEGIPTALLCEKFAPLIADSFFNDVNGVAAKALCDFYRSDDNKEQGRKFVDIMGDIFFVAPTVEALNIHTTDNERASYQYLFSKPSAANYLGPPPQWDSDRSNHASDLEYLFSMKSLTDPLENEETAGFSIQLIKYWTNFARTGNPNGEGLPVWPRYEPQDKAYQDLNLKISNGRDVYSDRMDLILNKIPQLLKNEKKRENRNEL